MDTYIILSGILLATHLEHHPVWLQYFAILIQFKRSGTLWYTSHGGGEVKTLTEVPLHVIPHWWGAKVWHREPHPFTHRVMNAKRASYLIGPLCDCRHRSFVEAWANKKRNRLHHVFWPPPRPPLTSPLNYPGGNGQCEWIGWVGGGVTLFECFLR